ncbi:cytochrome B [Mucilaginibacter terrenus]|uniref:Cytochrome B n=1 Tax=Mucilaginibacter terrenus TaxID=2482727 RepID=A0A3E2NNN7_9SPHI|nr:cytochrome B [Mucilaginibacter terrenus]RFZ82619.1 cytochrome B [Mucilaginibacter terrenus]
MTAYKFLLQAHSGFRYIVILLLVVAIVTALAGWFGKKTYTNGNRKLNLFTMISAHIQLLLGLALYFVSPFVKFDSGTMKDDTTRYWTVEHIAMMVFAIALITIGHARSKRAQLPEGKHRVIAIAYLLATLVVVVAILQSQRGLFGMTH